MTIRILAGSVLITSVQECLSQRTGWAGSFRFGRYAILEKNGWRCIDEKKLNSGARIPVQLFCSIIDIQIVKSL